MTTTTETMQLNQNRDDANHIRIFDTTLRDGEQSPGCSMNLEEKLRVASALEAMGVDIIEAGFPIASNGDFEAVSEIARTVKNSTVAGLSRANRKDIDRAWEALKHAARPRIHNFISTSPLHMEYKLQMEPGAVHVLMVDSISYARNLCDDVEWSPEDGTRTEHDFLCRCVESAIKAGASTINIPDTVGYTTPEEFHALISMLINRVPNIDKAVISVHCHNDRRQRRAGRDCHGAEGTQRHHALLHQRGDGADHADQPSDLDHYRLQRSAQQGDRRRQRVCARVRHPSGRHAETCRHL
jgi:2-isopropylmalate synthase